MRRLYAIAAVLLALLMCGGVPAARADQDDVRLDTLFGLLQRAASIEEAARISDRIWIIWTEIRDEAAYAEMMQGVSALAGHDLETALSLFDDIVGKHPEFAEGWNKRATVYYLMGRFDESLSDVETTLDLEPRHFGALTGKGLILMEMGNYALAIKAFEQALEANPHMPDVRMRIEVLKEKLENSAI